MAGDPRGTAPADAGWQAASGVTSWVFAMDTRAYGKGDFTINVRLLEQGVPTASTAVNVRFSGR